MSESENQEKKVVTPEIKYVRIKKHWIKHFLDFIPLISVLAAGIAIYFGYNNYQENLDLQKEIKAIELYKDYTLRLEQNPSLGDTSLTLHKENWNNNYILFAHYTLFISESIYTLREGDEAWENTLIEYILYPHIKFYEHNKSIDEALKENFREFYKKAADYYNSSQKKNK